jgi:hypothetical protein
MIRRSLVLTSFLVILVGGVLLLGCGEIPSEGHTPPDYKASIRVMYLDAAISGNVTIRLAPGPDFSTWSSSVFTPMPYGETTDYTTLDAGDKQLLVESVDADTSVQSFGADVRGTLVVLPRPDVSEDRFLLLGEGRIFEPVGVTGSSRIRFINAITQSATDSMEVEVDVIQLPDSSVAVAALEFRTSSSYFLVAADSVASFYLARSGTTDPITDSVPVTGQSNTDYTVVARGSSDAAVVELIPNQ